MLLIFKVPQDYLIVCTARDLTWQPLWLFYNKKKNLPLVPILFPLEIAWAKSDTFTPLSPWQQPPLWVEVPLAALELLYNSPNVTNFNLGRKLCCFSAMVACNGIVNCGQVTEGAPTSCFCVPLSTHVQHSKAPFSCIQEFKCRPACGQFLDCGGG